MLVDINKFEQKNLSCDVCIIGSGPAGTSIANKLKNTNKKIIIIEAGGKEIDSNKQKYFETDNYFLNTKSKFKFNETSANRLSCIGGTSQHWSGACNPFPEKHFNGRKWIPDSKWPISYNEIIPYYLEAQEYLELSPLSKLKYNFNLFDEEFLNKNHPNLFNFENLSYSFEKHSGFIKDEGFIEWDGPIRFKKIIYENFIKNSNINFFYNAYLTNLIISDNKKKINKIEVENYEKNKKIIISSKCFCLCCGGLENAKILLNNNIKNYPKSYNDNSLVGKYFLNHPVGRLGTLYAYDKKIALKFTQIFKNNKFKNNKVRPLIYLNDHIQQKEEILNHMILVESNYDEDSGVYSARKLRDSIVSKKIPENSVKLFFDIIKDLDKVIYQTYKEYMDLGVTMDVSEKIDLDCVFEQSPNINSKIFLTKTKDNFDNYNVAINWSLNNIDQKTPLVINQYLANEFKKNNIGRLRIPDWINDKTNLLGDREGTAHYSGTTRMANEKNKGVVDKNCIHHDLKNLYIASSSVFTTESFVNPTFTIVALSLRVADDILNRYK